MKGINRGYSRRFGSGGGHARMCGQGSHLRALKDKKVPGKEPGRESSSRTNSMCKALRSQRVVQPSTGKEKVNTAERS